MLGTNKLLGLIPLRKKINTFRIKVLVILTIYSYVIHVQVQT